MASERFPPDDPREWLNRARSSLALAGSRIPGVYLEDFCFDAQQAAEKAINGVLIAHRIEFPYVHGLARLLTLLEQDGELLPQHVKGAGRLTRFAFKTRYPEFGDSIIEEDYTAAVAWAEERIRPGDAPSPT